MNNIILDVSIFMVSLFYGQRFLIFFAVGTLFIFLILMIHTYYATLANTSILLRHLNGALGGY